MKRCVNSNTVLITVCLILTPWDFFPQQIQHTLDDMHAREVLTYKAYEFLSPTDCKPTRFYHQPKVHKEPIPVHPIVSGNGSPTENTSRFVDNFIKPLVSKAPSYIHDTPDLLRKLEAIKNQIPSTIIIGTFDVSSLYTNISRDEGVSACCKALNRKWPYPSSHWWPQSLNVRCTNYEKLHFHGWPLSTDLWD